MPNFAQECPFLLFLPFVIFTATAGIWGIIQLAILFEAKLKARQKLPEMAIIPPVTRLASPAKPALVMALEKQLSAEMILPVVSRELATTEP